MKRYLILLLAVLAIAGCTNSLGADVNPVPSGSTNGPRRPQPVQPPSNTIAGIMALSPFAYTGQCQVTRKADGQYFQPGISAAALEPVSHPPVPCVNLRASIGTYINGIPGSKIKPGDNYNESTPKTGIVFDSPINLGGGTWIVNWHASPGVTVDYFTAVTYTATGLTFIDPTTGSYLWHAYGSHKFPIMSIYGNDTSAAPGSTVGLTGQVLPHQLQAPKPDKAPSSPRVQPA